MATLIRTRDKSHEDRDHVLSRVPKPFPSTAEREQLVIEEVLEELANEAAFESDQAVFAGPSSLPSIGQPEPAPMERLHEIMPTIACVQKSCLSILKNLFSRSKGWNPIIPDRRRSLPEARIRELAHIDIEESNSALETLVSNLRGLEENNTENEAACSSHAGSDLVHELDMRIQSLSPSLPPDDATLARALASLLSDFHRLSIIYSSSPHPHSIVPPIRSAGPSDPTDDVFNTLQRQLSDLQVERRSQPDTGSPPNVAVESALFWSKIDEELERIVSMCRERTEGLPRFSTSEHLPPRYDHADFVYDTPPEYDSGDKMEPSERKPSPTTQREMALNTAPALSEKLRLDLEAVTMAIDRLYRVAPQLHDQRAELKVAKTKPVGKTRRENSRFTLQAGSSGKQKRRDFAELEHILDMLDKASDRKLMDQTVVLDAGMKAKLENSLLKEKEKRDAFVEQLLDHSHNGRLHNQDAILQPHKIKNPDTLLTLPEFIKESVPSSSQIADPHAMLTLPEFFNEPVPGYLMKTPDIQRLKSRHTLRSRSISAPPLSWLRPLSTRDVLHDSASHGMRRPSSAKGLGSSINVFNIHYVAESHENLQHILVFLTVSGTTPGSDLEAEVFSTSSDGEYLIIKSGTQTSAPLSLPGRAIPGKKAVKVQSGHYEIKLPIVTGCTSTSKSSHEPIPLMDASQLSASMPNTFICASCSLPVIHASTISGYRDLPSEHWEEFVDAWMCHSDQLLHDQVAKRSQGFWPDPGQALVGGSYILFEQSSVLRNNLRLADHPQIIGVHFPVAQLTTSVAKRLIPRELRLRAHPYDCANMLTALAQTGTEWRLLRCLCGAVVGRCQDNASKNATSAMVFRLLKYAIRPVSPSTEPLKIPLSAFIVEDLMEFVRAHATYRFVILDEEDERPRLLMWLFKQSMRLAYTTPVPYALPRSGSIHASKVLYKIIGPYVTPSELQSILHNYPGFPQAEHLYYPMDVCRRLATALKESNTAYPDSMQTMTGLHVGWLLRA